MHEEVVHGPVGLDAAATREAGELCIVSDAVQKGMEEDCLAVGAERSPAAGGEVQRFIPIDVRGKELLEDSCGLVVSGVDGLRGVERDAVVV